MTNTVDQAPRRPATLGLGLLIALVVGSIIGSGIFGLPQNMAASAGAGAILIGWLISGVGMLMLALVYQMLAMRKPELDNRIYAYARALSGEYTGFNSAWGYWVSAWIGNVGYLVAAFGALGYFFPVFGDGNTVAAVGAASLGVMPQAQLAGLKNPSMADVLEQAIGHWGAVLVYVGLIVSVGGGFLA